MAASSTVSGLAGAALASRPAFSTSFVRGGRRVSARNPLMTRNLDRNGRVTCMTFPRDWLRRDLNVIGFGLIGWIAPSSVPVINGNSLTGLFFSSIGEELAHFPTPPALTSQFWAKIIDLNSKLGTTEFYGGNYIQSVTKNLSLGTEAFWLGQQRKSGVGLVARYDTKNFVSFIVDSIKLSIIMMQLQEKRNWREQSETPIDFSMEAIGSLREVHGESLRNGHLGGVAVAVPRYKLMLQSMRCNWGSQIIQQREHCQTIRIAKTQLRLKQQKCGGVALSTFARGRARH